MREGSTQLRLMLLCLCCWLIMVPSAIPAQKNEGTTILPDIDESGKAFSFKEGGLVSVGDGISIPSNVDLVFDLPHGLGANNSELDRVFSGRGGILDMGMVPLDEVTEAPEAKFPLSLGPDELIVGHTYCVLTADGKHYGKFHLVKFSREEKFIEFRWQYQPKATRKF